MDKKKLLQERSKTRLKKEIKKRIETTMIGSLASIEKYFGELWGHANENKTPEQARFREIFEELRSEILDRGNNQIRQVESEVESYDVVWQKYHVNIPISRTY